ncbi:hypothetical protein ACFQH5_11405 [Halomonas salifodinae]|uniref:Uncharacterized protein n=1 Tax=Halomonas salifodinae TaxID=438745 RepID=A0ABW2EVW5_9GAMM
MPQCEAVVNVFQSAIGDPERFHPERHIALYPLPRRKELELLEL